MSFGGFGASPLRQSGLGFGEDQWNEYLRQIELQRQRQNYTGTGPVQAFGPDPVSSTRAGTSNPVNAGPPRSTPIGPAPPGVASTPGGASTPTTNTAITSARNTTVTNSGPRGDGGNDPGIGNDLVTHPGQYYSMYGPSQLGALASDPGGAAARAWAKFYGYGGDAYAKYLSGVYADPVTLLKAMGVNSGNLSDPADQLDYQRRLWDIASGRHKVGGNYGYLSGRGIVQNVLNAKIDNVSGSLGTLLNDPTSAPADQVKNTIGMLTGSLQSIVSQDALQAYGAMLQRLGQQFIDEKMRHPETQDSKLTFNLWLGRKLGPGGGLY